jgi:hypothetical protein
VVYGGRCHRSGELNRGVKTFVHVRSDGSLIALELGFLLRMSWWPIRHVLWCGSMQSFIMTRIGNETEGLQQCPPVMMVFQAVGATGCLSFGNL